MTDLHVVVEGAGPPLLTIHGGLGLDHTYLRAGLAGLADRFTLVHADVAGHGRSPAPADWAAQDLDVWADDLDAVRAARGHSRWDVLGHSYGALIAMAYALRHPDRVGRLVLVGGGPSFAHAGAVLAELDRRGHPEAAAALLAGLSAPARDDDHFGSVWLEVLPLYFHRWEPRYRDVFAGTRYSADGFNRGNELLGTLDFTPRLGAIAAPTLVLGGDDDFIMPADGPGAVLASGIPGARRQVIPGSGHFPFLEVPEATTSAIADFLAT
ncbi:MAG TPA: alpha/beta hydrolase [Kofleriaceae bacterium]|nr:alpha/beta hydrolase [Kofleriaceae bacterium]